MNLSDYLTILYRRKWVAITVAMAVLGAAAIYTLRQTPSYSADAQVLLSRQDVTAALSGAPQASSSTDAARDAETQADLARVPTVVRSTIDKAGVPITVGAFVDQSSVTSSPDSDLLEFQVEHRSARGAERLVNAYAREFASYRRTLDTASLLRARSEVKTRLEDLAASGGQEALYKKLANKNEELRVLLTLQTARAVVVRTADDATKVRPKPVRNGLLAVALALLAGTGLALLRDALDTRPRSALEIAEGLGLPLLARLPRAPSHIRKQNKLVMLEEPDGAAAEPFRMLRANLDVVNIDRDVRCIMVTSAVQEEGKSTTIANFAVAAARAGRRVILVDLDLRRGDIDSLFDVGRKPGITDVALGKVRLIDACVPIDIDPEENVPPQPSGFVLSSHERAGSLEILPVGNPPPNPGDFLLSDTVAGILKQLRRTTDLLIVDAPPVLQTGDALAISNQVDGIVVVTRLGIRRSTLDELSRVLGRLAADRLGVVITGDDFEQRHYGSYYTSRPAGADGHKSTETSSLTPDRDTS